MNFPGATQVIELGISHAEAMSDFMPTSVKESLAETLRKFIFQQIKFTEACESTQVLIHSIEPVEQIKEVLEVSETPLPACPEETHQSGQPFRRKTRTWTNGEDTRLIAGVLRYGTDNWQLVSRFLGGGRNRAQCSQRWSRCISPKISKKPWSPFEDQKLRDLVSVYGKKCWMNIARMMGNRSDVQVRYRWIQLGGSLEDTEDNLSLQPGGHMLISNGYLNVQNYEFNNHQTTYQNILNEQFSTTSSESSPDDRIQLSEKKLSNSSPVLLTQTPIPGLITDIPFYGSNQETIENFLQYFRK